MAELVHTVEYPSPRQRAIVESVRQRIVSGELAPGSRVPSVNELAAAHKSSSRTALGALGYLRQRGFITCQRGSGSFVSSTPPNLTQFGIVFPSRPDPDGWWLHYLYAWKREAERLAAPDGEGGRRGLSVSFYYLDERTPVIPELQSDLEADLLAGLIFPYFPHALRETAILADRRTPKVVCSEMHNEGFTSVSLADGLREKALQHLASRGRRRVAILLPTFHHHEALPTDSFIRLAASCGLTTHRYWIQGIDVDSPAWAANWTEFLCRPGSERPDALFITDDNLVQAATQGLLNAGVRVPDDIDVVAHCNFPYPTPSAVPAKRVGFDMRQILRTSVELIERQRRGEEAPPMVFLRALFDDELEPTAET